MLKWGVKAFEQVTFLRKEDADCEVEALKIKKQ